jgi:hypothetical protein
MNVRERRREPLDSRFDDGTDTLLGRGETWMPRLGYR